MQFKNILRQLIPSIILAITCQASLLAQQSEDNSTPQLPSERSAWINSLPISNETLKGKAAVLYFFEEECGKCRVEWKDRLKDAKQFEGKPVVFIAVNSGTPRGELETYLKEVGCNWPTICDAERALEKAFKVGDISLKNIYQARIITATGESRRASPVNIKQTAEDALEGAAWRIDPSAIPAALQPAWSCVEFDNCALAAPQIKKGLTSKKPELKEAADKLHAAVQTKIEKLLTQAKQAEEAGEKWNAYKLYQQVDDNFAGYEVTTDLAKAKKTLTSHEAVQKQLAALKKLKAIQKSIATPAGQRTAKTRLQKLIAEERASDAAIEAQKLLESVSP